MARAPFCQAFALEHLARSTIFARAWAHSAVDTADEPLYLHQDLRVRTGIFHDDAVVFESEDPDWVRFCSDALSFPPEWISELDDDSESAFHAAPERGDTHELG